MSPTVLRLKRCFECEKYIRKSPKPLSQPNLLACYRKFKNSPDESGVKKFLCSNCCSKVRTAARRKESCEKHKFYVLDSPPPCTGLSTAVFGNDTQVQRKLPAKEIEKDSIRDRCSRRNKKTNSREKRRKKQEVARLRRTNEITVSHDKTVKTEYFRKRRLDDSNARECDRVRDAASPKRTRKQPLVREMEQIKDTVSRRRTRQNPTIRDTEKLRDAASRNQTRQDPTVRRNETFRNTCLRRIQRIQPARKAKDLKASAKYKLSLMTKSPAVKELIRQQTNNRKQRARKSEIYRQRESMCLQRSRLEAQNEPLMRKLELFKQKIKEGPTYICTCCGSLWFRTSVVPLHEEQLRTKHSEAFVKSLLHVKSGWICLTCYKSTQKGTLPRLALSNGLDFPVIPDVLKNLNTLEERLVALRLPFITIRSLGVDKQCGAKGNVVHIENDLDTSVGCIPRTTDEAAIIPIILVRHLDHEKPYVFKNVSPFKVSEAAEYLLTTDLYKAMGATFSTKWKETLQTVRSIVPTSNPRDEKPCHDQNDCPQNEEMETMLIQYGSDAIKIAPGQGKKPLSLLQDVYAEEAAYPTIYGGQIRNLPVKVSLQDRWKSETRRYDRRCAKPHRVLHAFKLSQNHRVASSISVCLRKKKGKKATAGELLDNKYLSDFITHDFGYRLLKDVRTSPAYWESKTKHIFAMIRQLGVPTLFLTLSAAESHWPELLVILKKVLDNELISEEQAMSLKYEDKADLIRRDPVTCSRYFDYRLRTAFNLLFKPSQGIFCPFDLKDFYWRIEFQHRGSPHVHMLIWLKDVPKIDDSNNESCKWIDKLISCKYDTEGVIHQTHKHTKTCQRNTKSGIVCRFNIPYPPMRETCVLKPYGKEFPKTKLQKGKEVISKIKLFLEENRKNLPDLSYQEFLKHFAIEETDYISALRCTLSRTTVFLERNVRSCYTNSFITSLSRVWRSNMDVQAIIDPFGVARYIASYMTKSSGGISKLMKETSDQIAAGNLPLKDRMRQISNKFLNAVEVCAQEASYGLCEIPLTKSSRDIVFIPTGPPDERIVFLKSTVELKNLDGDSTDVAAKGLLDHYAQRPNELSQMCLAEYASMYTFSTKRTNKISEDANDEVEPIEIESEDILPTVLPLKNNSGFIRKRKFPKIIRFRRYGEKENASEFYRECVMLYMPWTDEKADILDKDWTELYKINQSDITETRLKYNMLATEALEAYTEIEDSENDDETDDEYNALDDFRDQADIFNELFPRQKQEKIEKVPIPDLLCDTEYEHLITELNEKQSQYVWHVLSNLKKGNRFLEFVYGGAGVGKSKLIDAVVQSG